MELIATAGAFVVLFSTWVLLPKQLIRNKYLSPPKNLVYRDQGSSVPGLSLSSQSPYLIPALAPNIYGPKRYPQLPGREMKTSQKL